MSSRKSLSRQEKRKIRLWALVAMGLAPLLFLLGIYLPAIVGVPLACASVIGFLAALVKLVMPRFSIMDLLIALP